jgi:hypothetical protein
METSSSSSNGSGIRLMRLDLENNIGAKEERRSFVRVWKVPLPLRRDHVVSDLFKTLAFLMTTL